MPNTELPAISVTGCTTFPESAGDTASWTRFSLPLPEGSMPAEVPLALLSDTGTRIPLQTRALATWNDDSIRWLDCQGLVQRDGAYGILNEAVDLDTTRAVTVTEQEGNVTLANAAVSITLSVTGPSPVARITLGEKPVSANPVAFEAQVTDAQGGVFSSRFDESRRLCLRERGPVRALADVHGSHGLSAGGRMLSYRLRAEVIGNLPVIILRYQFVHDDPGHEHHSVRAITATTRWRAPDPATRLLHQKRYSLLSVQRPVETTHPVQIRSDAENPKIRVHNLECLEDEHEYPPFAQGPMDDAFPYLGLALEDGCVLGHVDDFMELHPKGLTGQEKELTLEAWPAWAELAKVHQGWSREMTLRLVFADTPAHPGGPYVHSHVSASTDTGRVSLPPSSYAAGGCFHVDSVLPKGPPSPQRFDRYLAKLSGLPTVMGMWDLGDTIDPGYTSTYEQVGRLARAEGAPPRRFYTTSIPAFMCQANMVFNEPVWTNNEYDVILALAREYMRGNANPGLWQKLRWFGRHAIEVDFISYSDHPQLHHGSPAHSANHCAASAYPSHLWCEGLLGYYCLSGDADALETALHVGDFIVDTFADPGRRGKLFKFTREIGWALLYTATLYDLVREERFLSQSQEFAQLILREPITDGLADNMLRFSFAYSSLALGMEALHRVSAEKPVADWLVHAADRVLETCRKGLISVESCMTFNYYNAAYAVSRDETYLRAGMGILERLMDSRAWTDPWLHTKPVAMAHRGLSRFLFYAHACGLLEKLDYRY